MLENNIDKRFFRMDILNKEEKYIYKKSDFLNLGVKEGSFLKLIKDLELDQSEFMTKKFLKENRNRPVLYFTAEAYQKVAKYLQDKKKSKGNQELLLIDKVNSLTEENQNLKNVVAMLESQYTKEISELKDSWHKKENEWHIKDKQLSEKQKEIEFLENMSLWQFIKWRKNRKNNY